MTNDSRTITSYSSRCIRSKEHPLFTPHSLRGRRARMSRLSIALALFVAFTLSAVAQAAGPAEGTWTWETPARGERPAQKYTLKITQDGEKLTGKVSVPGRGENAQPREIDIKD